MLLLPACETEERLIGYRPMLGGLPGAESGTEVAPPPGAEADPTKLASGELEQKNPDGTTHLIARTARHVMIHVSNTLTKDDPKLFLQEVLSERTKDEYTRHGQSPADAFATLKARQADIARLFDQMPMGEYTPGLFLEPVGGGVQRLQITGKLARGLSWTGIDIVMEHGNYRLVWFSTPEH